MAPLFGERGGEIAKLRREIVMDKQHLHLNVAAALLNDDQ
jgi:hypothetical protein